MNPLENSETQPVDQFPARALLEGLARIYELVLVTDFDGKVLWMCNRLVELCGGAGFEIGSMAQTILPKLAEPPVPEQVFALRSQLRQHGHLTNVRIDLPVRGAATVPVEVNMMRVSTPLDERPYHVIIARRLDGSNQHEAGSQPRASAETLASILDDAPDAVLAVDERGFVAYANVAVERLTGHAPETIVGQPVAALLSDADDLERLMSSLGADGVLGDWDLRLTKRDGSAISVAASARTRQRADGSFGGTVLCLRDATERHTASAELKHKNAELEHCVQALAHDLRSPLVALLGFSRLLRQDYGAHLDETGNHFLDRIEQAGRTMEDLIHDLLELSRIGQPGERRSLVDPKSILHQLHAELKPRLDAGSVRLHLPSNPPLIYCDRTRLYQVFSNLIGNAIDHMGSCDDPHVTVSVLDEEDCHHISVSDAGKGIAPEHHERVFDVFQSLGPATDGRRGTGIGLAIVKKIAETHGGRVWLESSPQTGAAFHVTFPHR